MAGNKRSATETTRWSGKWRQAAEIAAVPDRTGTDQLTGRTVEQREADLAQAREVAAEVRAREAAERQQDRGRDREQEAER